MSIFDLFPLMSCIEEKLILCTKKVIMLSSSDYTLYEDLDEEVRFYVCTYILTLVIHVSFTYYNL